LYLSSMHKVRVIEQFLEMTLTEMYSKKGLWKLNGTLRLDLKCKIMAFQKCGRKKYTKKGDDDISSTQALLFICQRKGVSQTADWFRTSDWLRAVLASHWSNQPLVLQ